MRKYAKCIMHGLSPYFLKVFFFFFIIVYVFGSQSADCATKKRYWGKSQGASTSMPFYKPVKCKRVSLWNKQLESPEMIWGTSNGIVLVKTWSKTIALDIETGKQLWDSYSASHVWFLAKEYILVRWEKEYPLFSILRLKDGEEVWRNFNEPLIKGYDAEGYVAESKIILRKADMWVCFDWNIRKIIWEKENPSFSIEKCSTNFLAGYKTTTVNGKDSIALTVISSSTGNEMFSIPQEIRGFITVDEKGVVLLVNDPNCNITPSPNLCYSIKTYDSGGKILWNKILQSNYIPSISADNKMVYLLSVSLNGNKTLHAFDRGNGETSWACEDDSFKAAKNPEIFDNVIIALPLVIRNDGKVFYVAKQKAATTYDACYSDGVLVVLNDCKLAGINLQHCFR